VSVTLCLLLVDDVGLSVDILYLNVEALFIYLLDWNCFLRYL